MENIGDCFFSIEKSKTKWSKRYIENISFDRNDESEFVKKLTVVRNGSLTGLLIAFDMALTEKEFGPKKIDRNDDLTALEI